MKYSGLTLFEYTDLRFRARRVISAQNRMRRVNVVKNTRHPKSSKMVSSASENSVMLNVSWRFVSGTTRKKLVRNAAVQQSMARKVFWVVGLHVGMPVRVMRTSWMNGRTMRSE